MYDCTAVKGKGEKKKQKKQCRPILGRGSNLDWEVTSLCTPSSQFSPLAQQQKVFLHCIQNIIIAKNKFILDCFKSSELG